ncbi:hypothetical protein H6P81_018123 [Aristolochia fimbriata]|uniref:Uncharacterized protein n=1 Tax=Aristolochia fimbriata TaxID=158543 RepID=A0AAV7E1Z9_ARIFI|nr:hypothetical protein H6P81_018123 [Aristolochia fimbriata]
MWVKMTKWMRFLSFDSFNLASLIPPHPATDEKEKSPARALHGKKTEKKPHLRKFLPNSTFNLLLSLSLSAPRYPSAIPVKKRHFRCSEGASANRRFGNSINIYFRALRKTGRMTVVCSNSPICRGVRTAEMRALVSMKLRHAEAGKKETGTREDSVMFLVLVLSLVDFVPSACLS